MSDTEKQPTKQRRNNQPNSDIASLEKPDIVAIELRRAREAKGLSHSDLHRQTGISRPVLFGYEAGRTKPGAKELRLLSEALEISPNRLLFGTEEPFKARPGLQSLVKLRNSPVFLLWGMMLFPIAFAALDEDQAESLFTIIGSMVEARDKETYKKLSVMAEILSEEIGNGTPEEISAMAKRASAPDYQTKLAQEIEDRLKNIG